MMKKIKKHFKKSKVSSIRFLQYSDIKKLNQEDKIKKILELVLKNEILILQGKLSNEEKTKLIEKTMKEIGKEKDFKGIELAVNSEEKNKKIFEKIKKKILKIIYGSEIGTLTVIGPATIVKEIKKDPKRIDLLFNY